VRQESCLLRWRRHRPTVPLPPFPPLQASPSIPPPPPPPSPLSSPQGYGLTYLLQLTRLRLGLHKHAKEGLLCLLESCTRREFEGVRPQGQPQGLQSGWWATQQFQLCSPIDPKDGRQTRVPLQSLPKAWPP
jgi:hypothetical protein